MAATGSSAAGAGGGPALTAAPSAAGVTGVAPSVHHSADVRVVAADCASKEVEAEVIAAAVRGVRAHAKGEKRSWQEVRVNVRTHAGAAPPAVGVPNARLTVHTQVAESIRNEVVEKAPGAWHVVCGPQFGSFITHESGSCVHVLVGAVGVLVFKHG